MLQGKESKPEKTVAQNPVTAASQKSAYLILFYSFTISFEKKL